MALLLVAALVIFSACTLPAAQTPIATEEPAAIVEEPAQGPTWTEPPILPTTAPPQPEEKASIVLIGMENMPIPLSEVAQGIEDRTGFTTDVNRDASTAELVLFVVHAADGPMPATREEIENLRGQTIARAAILLTGTELQGDVELQQLVELEMRDLLGRNIGSFRADQLQLLDANAPDLAARFQALIDSPPANITMGDTTRPSPAGAAIVLVGMPDTIPTLDQVAQSLQDQTGYATDVNRNASTAELVLFTVHAPDGPMPRTREEIENLRGQTVLRAAILLTGTETLNDPELLQLVELEMRELLGRNMDPALAQGLQVLHSNDPFLPDQLQALIDSDPVYITLGEY